MPGTFYTSIIVPGAIMLPVVAAVIKMRYWSASEKVIFAYMITSALFNILAASLAARNINNLPLLHVYTVLEFMLVTGFFITATDNKKEKTIIRCLWIIFPILALLNILYLNSVFLYNQMPRSVGAIIILILCIYFLMKSLSFSAAPVPFFNFAIVVALLLYFSGSLALFALSNFIIGNKRINLLIWNTHATFVLIMYLIIAIAYFKTRKDQ